MWSPSPESLSCVLLTPDILIDYGEFHKSDILDNTLDKRKNGTFKIKCDRDATVLLSLISPDEENSSNRGTRIVFDTDYDLVSYLTVNDKAALTPTPFEVTGGENGTEFKVTSELALEGEHKVVLGHFLPMPILFYHTNSYFSVLQSNIAIFKILLY